MIAYDCAPADVGDSNFELVLLLLHVQIDPVHHLPVQGYFRTVALLENEFVNKLIKYVRRGTESKCLFPFPPPLDPRSSS